MEVVKYHSRFPNIYTTPCLLYSHESKKSTIQTLHSLSSLVHDNNSYALKIRKLRGKQIFGCCDGNWVILRNLIDERVFSIYNHVTQRLITLPQLESSEKILSCALIYPPNDNSNGGCMTILLFKEGEALSCQINRNTASKIWVQHRIWLDGEEETKIDIDHAVTCNGLLYGYGNGKNGRCLYKIQVTDYYTKSPNLKILRSLKDPIKDEFITRNPIQYLVESDGRLYLACLWLRMEFMTYMIQEIVKAGVWELNTEQMIWVKTDSLNDRAFLLGENCSTSCRAGGNIKGNCIYLSIKGIKGFDIVLLYKMQECSFTFLLPCPDMRTTTGSCWLMPSKQRLSPSNELDLLKHNLDQANIHIHPAEAEQELQMQANTGSLCELSLDMMLLVSKYLHWFDYVKLRATCKAFQSTIPPEPLWRPSTSNNEYPSSSSLPLFMFNKNNKGLFELRDLSRDDALTINIGHDSSRFPSSIEYSKNGWLLLCYGGEEPQRLFNIFSREEAVPLPYETFMDDFDGVGFSASPTSPDFLIVGIHFFSSLHYFQLGDDSWQSYEFKDEEFKVGRSCPIFHDGSFYFIDQLGCLGVFKLEDRRPSWHVYDDLPKLKDTYDHWRYLVECDGEILSIFIGEMGRWVQVFKFDALGEKWVELQSLGDHMLFISRNSCISVKAKEKEMENRIYLPWLKEDEVVFYSLNTCMYHTAKSGQTMQNFYHMEGPSISCWIY